MTNAPNRLTPRERIFVHAIAGGEKKAQAATTAGYSSKSASQAATRLLTRERVLVAIQRAAEQKLRAGVAVGVTVLVRLAREAKSEDVRYKAACAILDRVGLPLIKTTETRHLIEDRRTEAELIEHVRRLAGELKVALPAGLIEGQGEPGDVSAGGGR